MAAALHVKDIDLNEFQSDVIEESFRRPVAVDFWAAWCAPCRVLGPVLERLAAEFDGDFLLAKVDTEENPELAEQFGIRSIPNVKIFKDGEVVDEVIGALPEAEVRGFLRRHCPTPSDRKFAEGKRLLGKGSTREARALFEAALGEDPSHPGSLLEMGKLLAHEGDIEGAASMWEKIPAQSALYEQASMLKRSIQIQRVCRDGGGIEACRSRAEADPEDLEARYSLGCCLAVEKDYRAALEEFLYVVGRDRNYRDDAARKAMLTVFGLVGERSDLAEEFRKRLAMTLF